MSTWCHFIPDLKNESKLLKFFNHIWIHQNWELRPIVKVRLTLTIHDRANQFFNRWESLVANVKVSLWQIQIDRVLVLINFYLGNIHLTVSVVYLSIILSSFCSLQVVETFNLHTISVELDTAAANLCNVEVELGKRWLLLHQHHCALFLHNGFKLCLLLAHLLLVLEFHLIISLKLFLSVTSLQIELNLDIANMCFNFLRLAVFCLSCLVSFHLYKIFAAFFSLELFFFLLLSGHLGGF